MHYEFPEIHHIDEVLEAIRGVEGFVVSERDETATGRPFTIIAYAFTHPDMFPPVVDRRTALMRECRGITFDKQTGRVISRPYHKFFVLNQREETQRGNIHLGISHEIMDKLDGSMIRPIPVLDPSRPNGWFRLATKMGVTDVALQAEEFLTTNPGPDYATYIKNAIDENYTPIFEWCSRKQRIVLDYSRDQLLLTAVRHNVTGIYMPLDEADWEFKGHAKAARLHTDVPTVNTEEGGSASLQNLIDDCMTAEGMEGYIVRYHTGHMFKLKTPWYCLRHNSKDRLTLEKNVISMLITDEDDDVMSHLSPNDQEALMSFKKKMLAGLMETASLMTRRACRLIQESGNDRKVFALGIAPTMSDTDVQFVFATWSGKVTAMEYLQKKVALNCGTQSRVDSVRHLWGGHKWDYVFEGDE